MRVQWRFEGDFDDLFKGALKQQLDHVEAELDQVRCPVHGKAPTIVVKGHTAEDISANVEGCCEELGQLARERLKALGFENDA